MKTFFKKSYGRNAIWRRIAHFYCERRFSKLAALHLKDSPQLVVFSFDYISLQIAGYGSYERQELETFFDWIHSMSPGYLSTGVGVDVGANIGNHALAFSRHLKHVHAFEPNPRTFKVLSLNSELASNVTCYQLGLGRGADILNLENIPSNIGGSRIVSHSNSHTTPVRIVALDEAMADVSNIRLIKIDVEGHEDAVLAGAEEVIKKHQPVVIFEQLAECFKDGESASIKLLKTFGYERFAVIRRGPCAPNCWPTFARSIYTIAARVIVGEKIYIENVSTFRKQFYPLIVALPSHLSVGVLK